MANWCGALHGLSRNTKASVVQHACNLQSAVASSTTAHTHTHPAVRATLALGEHCAMCGGQAVIGTCTCSWSRGFQGRGGGKMKDPPSALSANCSDSGACTLPEGS
uniref:Uncharacterized protein n=1 Tax=Haptolina brevifila TaxID=156173 RepID=A0A7S2BPF3_9EUKA|mmetsp:Transcript_15158/g.30410  ORF Transcript_15158/g.30410 Transcript_15158/m.30410 type:complete len:106 (+) Transcript_15158:256-573(+)